MTTEQYDLFNGWLASTLSYWKIRSLIGELPSHDEIESSINQMMETMKILVEIEPLADTVQQCVVRTLHKRKRLTDKSNDKDKLNRINSLIESMNYCNCFYRGLLSAEKTNS